VATITVNNLNETSRNDIKKDELLIINAGYEDDIGAVFVGKVASVSHKHDNVDWTTKITATAALDEWIAKDVNKTYQKNTSAETIVADLLNLFGMEVGQISLVKNPTYARGKVCKGKLKDVLTEIITSDCKSRFMVKNGQVIVNNPNGGEAKNYLLSAETGLLRMNTEQVTVQPEQAQTTTEDKTQKKEKESGVKVECLMNYNIGAGDLVMIRSKTMNGRFLILRGSHNGSRTGDWKTELEVRPI
jgi:hypothetical protein